jgi:hypothetical protein
VAEGAICASHRTFIPSNMLFSVLCSIIMLGGCCPLDFTAAPVLLARKAIIWLDAISFNGMR